LQRWQEAMRDRCVCFSSHRLPYGPGDNHPFSRFVQASCSSRDAGRRVEWMFSTLSTRSCTCTCFSVCSFLCPIPRDQHHGLVYRIFKLFFLLLNNTILLDVSRCLRFAIEISQKYNSISYGLFA
jgi:hypothetical protein